MPDTSSLILNDKSELARRVDKIENADQRSLLEIEGVRHRCHAMHHASIGNRTVKITANKVARFKEYRQGVYTILPFVIRINTFVPQRPITNNRGRILHFTVSPSSIVNPAKVPVKTPLILLDRHLQVKKSGNLKLEHLRHTGESIRARTSDKGGLHDPISRASSFRSASV